MTVIMQSTLGYLQRVYLWPKSKNYSTKQAFLILFSASFLLVGSALNLGFSNKYTVASLENVVSQIGVMYFSTTFLQNQNSIVEIISELSDFQKFGKPPHFQQRNQELNTIAIIFKVLLFSMTIVIFLWPVIYTQCDNRPCGFAAPIWLPFEYEKSPIKELVYFWQCYCCLVTYGAAGMISMAILETMEHLVVRIQHLKMLIKEVVDEEHLSVKRELLKRWVEYHIHIFELAQKMNQNYRTALAVHVVVAGMLFGIIGHTLTKSAFSLDAVSLFVGWFTSFGVVCIGGQHLMDESLSVFSAVYDTHWYNLDATFQKNISLIILRSQREILISAGPFAYLSLALSLVVLRTAYSYLNLLSATS